MRKTVVAIIIIIYFTLLAEQRKFVPLNQYDSLLNVSNNINFNSPVFNRDSIAKYNYDGYIHTLRSYLYPNNTDLKDNELFNKYKLYQKYKSKGGKLKSNNLLSNIAMVAEFRRVLGKNPYNYIGACEYYYEYEITEIIFDAYDFYKLGDKIKVYQSISSERFIENDTHANLIFLSMYDKEVLYNNDRFENERIEKSLMPILIDFYSTFHYDKLHENSYIFGLYSIDEIREKYDEINEIKRDNMNLLYWYEYDFESLMEKIDE